MQINTCKILKGMCMFAAEDTKRSPQDKIQQKKSLIMHKLLFL